MSPRKLSVTTATGALLGGIVLPLTLGACSHDPSGAPRARETNAQTNPQTGADGQPEADRETQEEEMRVNPIPTGNLLDEELGGQEAIDALGDNTEVVAQRLGISAEALKALLLRDPSARVTPKGFVIYRDAFPTQDDQ